LSILHFKTFLKLLKGLHAMRLSLSHKLIAGGLLFAAAAWMLMSGSQPETDSIKTTMGATEASIAVIRDENLQLCQGIDNGYSSATMACGCQGSCSCGAVAQTSGFGYAQPIANVPMNPNPGRSLQGVNQFTTGAGGREGKWRDSQNVPWEQMAYGEYITSVSTDCVSTISLSLSTCELAKNLLSRINFLLVTRFKSAQQSTRVLIKPTS
jgi:hypothetical protein